jgi:hypothetical protein
LGTDGFWGVAKATNPKHFTNQLATCKKFEFRIAATNKHGTGTFTPENGHLEAETSCPEEDIPPPPGKVQVSEESFNTLDTQWVTTGNNNVHTLA